MTHSIVLNQIYEDALIKAYDAGYSPTGLDKELLDCVEIIASRSESNKGIVTVLTTLLAHKIVNPSQDIRNHQAGMENGFAGRVIDKATVTPFMKSVSFPAMAESGWLTRSLEQPEAYNLQYRGKITPIAVKTAFLTILDMIQVQNVPAEKTLGYFFVLLIKKRDSLTVDLAKPHSLSISAIIALLEKHFSAKYATSGASRLPTLAIYAAYQCMMNQVARYREKVLCPLVSHNSADIKSGRIGDVDVNNPDGTAFEGVEIKHGIVIARGHISDSYEKFKAHNTDRYYLLTTASMDKADWAGINDEIHRISDIHGCQVIVNGVSSSLRYYLRLLKDPAEFIENYVDAMKVDETIKFQHKAIWNDIVSGKIVS